MLIEVSVTLDHFGLSAVKMGLAALSAQAQKVSESIDAQVQLQVDRENAKGEEQAQGNSTAHPVVSNGANFGA